MKCDQLPKEVVIVHGREIGAIKTISNEISLGLKEKKINNYFFNMSDCGSSMLKKVLHSYRNLKKLSKNNLYIFMHFDPIMVGLLLGLRGFKNKVNVIHTDLVEYFCALPWTRKIIFKIILFFLRKECFVFVSKEAELKSKDKFGLKNTQTIYNIHNFKPIAKQKKSKSTNNFILGSVSRLDERKNIDLIIRVFQQLSNDDGSIKLYIYGAGAEKSNLIEYIAKANLSDQIILMGEVLDKEKIYSSIDALISLSSYEGFGMTIVESVGFQKPVFYTDCSSGPREIMSPDSIPLNKTQYYEKTNVGYLVRPITHKRLYARGLNEHEMVYVELLKQFISEVKESNFNMEYDSNRFSRKNITDQWEVLINTFGNFYLE